MQFVEGLQALPTVNIRSRNAERIIPDQIPRSGTVIDFFCFLAWPVNTSWNMSRAFWHYVRWVIFSMRTHWTIFYFQCRTAVIDTLTLTFTLSLTLTP